VEHRQGQTRGFDAQRGPFGNLIGLTKLNSGRHGGGFSHVSDRGKLNGIIDHGFESPVNAMAIEPLAVWLEESAQPAL
jgi:hypothetical protein